MKIYFLSIAFISAAGAFSITNKCSSLGRTTIESNTLLFADTSGSESTTRFRKPLSPKEILAQQEAKTGLPDPDKHPKLFSDELLDDMKEILIILEKRIQEGPGSIDAAEVKKFSGMSNNVLDEMKQKEYERLEDAKSPAPTSTTETVVSESSATVASASVDTIEKPPSAEEKESAYNPTEEGPAYSPDGGQGSMARGTRNTYIIPGMDEMSSDEYRDALQKTISERQSRRHETGLYGNRNTWDYLNNLSGDTGVLKKDKDKLDN